MSFEKKKFIGLNNDGVKNTLTIKMDVKTRALIHFPAMINFILLGVMRRLNGRKTQSCRSIAINDKVTELTTAQRKLFDIAL